MGTYTLNRNRLLLSRCLFFLHVIRLSAGLAAPWSLTVPRGQKVETRLELQPGLTAPLAQGAVVGKVVATWNGKVLGEAPLVAQTAVEKSGWLMLGWQHLMRLIGR